MFPKLAEIGLDGSPRTKKDGPFLRELSAGVYTTMSEKMRGYSQSETEDMNMLRYKTFIVFLALWENKKGVETPIFLSIANNWYENKGKSNKHKKLTYDKGEYTQLIRKMAPDDFISVTDYFADQSTRGWIEALYDVTDQHLQPTSEAVQEALKNE